MDTIGKFRTNFLGKGKSFNIGFNNRSPFDYRSSMPTNFISIPTISASPGDYALGANYAFFNTGGAEFTRSLGTLAKTIKDKSDRKKQAKLQERATQQEYDPAGNVMKELNLPDKRKV